MSVSYSITAFKRGEYEKEVHLNSVHVHARGKKVLKRKKRKKKKILKLMVPLDNKAMIRLQVCVC